MKKNEKHNFQNIVVTAIYCIYVTAFTKTRSFKENGNSNSKSRYQVQLTVFALFLFKCVTKNKNSAKMALMAFKSEEKL